MFTNVFAKILFVFIICLNVGCAGTQVTENEINERAINEERFETAFEGENVREKNDNLKDNKTSSLNDVKFRNLEWGMSLEEVLKAEDIESVNKIEEDTEYPIEYIDEGIYFSDVVGGLKTIVLMYFSENQLVGGTQLFQEQHHYKNKYIDDFEDVENILINKYGPASSSEIIWKNESWKDNPGYYGHAVALGHLEYEAEWYTANSIISHFLVGDGYEIDHFINYLSKQFKNKIEVKGLDKF